MASSAINIVMASKPLLWTPHYIPNQPPDIATWIYFRYNCSKQNSPFSSSPLPPRPSLLRPFLSENWLICCSDHEPKSNPWLLLVFIYHSQVLPQIGWILFQNVSPVCFPECNAAILIQACSISPLRYSNISHVFPLTHCCPVSSLTAARVVFIKHQLVSYCN